MRILKKIELKLTTVLGCIIVLLGICIVLPIGHNGIMTIRENIVHHAFRNPDFWRHLLILCGMLLILFGSVLASIQINNKLVIKKRCFFLMSYVYMSIPTVTFLLGMLRFPLGYIFTVILLFGLFWHLKNDFQKDEVLFEIPLNCLTVLVAGILIWVMMTGIGGFAPQRMDIHWRNVYLHDFAEYSWPLVYPESGYAPSYYWAYFLFPSLIGKLFGFLGTNITVYIFSACGIILAELLVFSFLKILHIVS